jgi:hypothetical protein
LQENSHANLKKCIRKNAQYLYGLHRADREREDGKVLLDLREGVSSRARTYASSGHMTLLAL